MTLFATPDDSHQHSLQTLEQLYEYDDFMESITTLVDLGCGDGKDLEWWATRTTRDDNPQPLNIKCTGVDLAETLPMSKMYPNITYQSTDFEENIFTVGNGKYDVLWCHDSFQQVINPIQTLSKWWDITSDGGMLAITVPETTTIKHHKMAFTQESFCYYHYTLVNLIHMLAVTGWDCRSGFFSKKPTDPWLHAIVYKSEHKPMNPRTTDWHTLSEMKLLPESADISILKYGELNQRDLLLPWIDQSLSDLSQQ